MESLITTPVRPLEVVAGKIIPYLVIGAFDVVVTFLAGYFIFGIHLRGSFLELLLLALLFLFGTSMLGIVISAVTRVQVVSIQAAMIITYLPSFILSGFIFPIQNMPMLIQGLTYLIPARYMIVIIRSIVLKGIPAMFLKAQIIFMALFALLVFIAAVSRLRSSIMARG
jgi:ABC-2 type transport system permease protein